MFTPKDAQAIKVDQRVKEILQMVPVVIVCDGRDEVIDTCEGGLPHSGDSPGRVRGSNHPGLEGSMIRTREADELHSRKP